MRVIDAFDRAVQAVAVSPDGRFLAATSAGHALAVWDWSGGLQLWRSVCPGDRQLSFSPDGFWLASAGAGDLLVRGTDGRPATRPPAGPAPAYAGGVAFAPSGRYLVASRTGAKPLHGLALAGAGQLDRWAVPTWHRAMGFDSFCPAFPRIAFSPNGDFLAGINPLVCELRFAVSGGLHGRVRMLGRGRHEFLSFSPDSRALVCGWDAELHVVETAGGREAGRVNAPDAPFRDAAFTGTGRHVGTVDEGGVLRLWDADRWDVDVAYEWGAGPLTCLAFAADGFAGVCGTAHGQLVLFDLD